MENKKNDAIECIYHIGKTIMLSLILSADFGEDTSEEREAMKKIKNYSLFFSMMYFFLSCWKL